MSLNIPRGFEGDVISQENSEYPQAIARWATNASLPAKYVFFPKHAQDISLAVKYATSNKLPIAIKGGGHSTTGANSVKDGIVIDLGRYVNTARIDPKEQRAYVGGGAKWVAVEAAAIQHGLAAVCGVVNDVGVGGLSLGAGYGHLSGAHGLAVDNILEVTVVIANGQVLRANEAENADLFWAIRGGGSNFGVVTEFVIKLHPQRPKVFAGTAIFPGAMTEKVCGTLAEMWKTASQHQSAQVYCTYPPPDKQLVALVLVFYNGPEDEGRKIFKPLFDLGPLLNTCAGMPYENVTTLLNRPPVPGNSVINTTSSHVITESVLHRPVYDKLASLSVDPEITFMVMFDFLTPNAIVSIDPDSMAFAGRGPQGNVSISGSWIHNDSTSKDVKDRTRKGVNEIRDICVSLQDFKYTVTENSGASGLEIEPGSAKAMFKTHYPKLQKLKAKYDPDCIFSRWYAITPAA